MTTQPLTADEAWAVIERDRNELRAENDRLQTIVSESTRFIEKMRGVYEAALEWRRCDVSPTVQEDCGCLHTLADAVDAAMEAK